MTNQNIIWDIETQQFLPPNKSFDAQSKSVRIINVEY